VITERGAVTGIQAGTTWSYRGIPYAAPPVGALRWKPPQPAACIESELQATDWGAKCPQFEGNGTGAVIGDEDCLTVNVWTPETPPSAPLPVMVWIHGGGHTQGSTAEVIADEHIYDAQRMVEQADVVVVSLNYRLGPLGWLAHTELTQEGEPKTSGMYGHLDQIAALEWVQRNAAAFGGDPNRVLIFGESAGGASVCTLIASPLAKGLFSSAVMQSGGCVGKPLADAEAFGAEVFGAAGCADAGDPVACMRELSTSEVLEALPVVIDVAGKVSGYGSVIDGYALLGRPDQVIAAGDHNAVPWIVGANSDETSKSAPLPLTATEQQYQTAVTALAGAALAPTVLAAYPASEYPSPWAAYVALTSDAKFICGARRALRAAVAGQSAPVYRYHFTHALDNAPAQAVYGAWHGVDVLYTFDHLEIANYIPSAAEIAIADGMIGYWSRLAATGDPNGDGVAAWPAYDANDPYLRFDDPIESDTGVRTTQCDFWDSLTD
jgi:para-nitrobenzyl esterase